MPHATAEARAEYARRYAATPEGFFARKAAQRAWRQKNQKAYRARLRAKAIEIYGGKCAKCGTLDGLVIDHIAGDGDEHRRREASAKTISEWLRAHKYPPGFQVLCQSCNIKKRNPTRRTREQ
jgi:5-methylcytosine-specific restriction endonuclease McrA